MFKVAIVVRTKDRALLLARALENIFQQSFQDFVVCVVNDGGCKDSLAKVLDSLCGQQRKKIIVKHNEVSSGMEKASNIGIDSTDSEYVAVHDDDDLWDKTFLQKTVSFLENVANQNFAGVMVRTKIVEEKIVGNKIVTTGSRILEPDMLRISFVDVLTINRAVPISFLYKRAVHGEIGFYDEKLLAVGDWEFYLRFLSKFEIGFIDGDPLAFWCHRVDSVGADSNSFFAKRDEHIYFDSLVRDKYIRENVSQANIGSYLFQAKLVQNFQHLLHQQQEVLHKLVGEMEVQKNALKSLEEQVIVRTSFSNMLRRFPVAVKKLRKKRNFVSR